MVDLICWLLGLVFLMSYIYTGAMCVLDGDYVWWHPFVGALTLPFLVIYSGLKLVAIWSVIFAVLALYFYVVKLCVDFLKFAWSLL